jgi:hypothetical protein
VWTTRNLEEIFRKGGEQGHLYPAPALALGRARLRGLL